MLNKCSVKQPNSCINKVLIFGAGLYGNKCLSDIRKKCGNNEIVIGFLDNSEKIQRSVLCGKYPCYPPKRVTELEYDKIIIANNTSDEIRSQIFNQLLMLGVPSANIEFFPADLIERSDDSRVLFFENFARFIKEQDIAGNVAECGVHAGEAAKYINKFFSDRKLYLFDTFEGFAQQDIEAERNLNDTDFLEGGFNFVGGWNHSIDVVMAKMAFPGNVVVKQGWVPESLEGIEDTFCFVNLDMDLYQPMLAATIFFWNRMSKGGVLLLHDYYLQTLPGVKKAVDDFEIQLGRKVPKIPAYGSIALIKD